MNIPAEVYADLTADPNLTVLDHGLWALVHARGPESLAELARFAHLTWNRTRVGCRRLAQAGWLTYTRQDLRTQLASLVPVATQTKAAAALEREYSLTANRGEFLMKRQLDLLLFADRFVDNARPEFLESPASGQPLEYDRFYLDGVAFEFNGQQHSGPTASGGEQAYRDTLTRDLIKLALSRQAKVELVVITAEDLRPERLERLIPPHLRRRPADADGPYYRTLARISCAYAERAQRATRK